MSARIDTAFLDRDGVINRKAPDGEYIESWAQFEFLHGAVEAIRSLHAAGIRIVIVTNQRGIAQGRMTQAAVDEIHVRMNESLFGADREGATVLVCPHEIGSCNCRKPELGLFRQAKARFPGIDARSSVVVGDSAVDVLFGNRLGCRTYLVADKRQAAVILNSHSRSRVDGVASSLLNLAVGTLLIGHRPQTIDDDEVRPLE